MDILAAGYIKGRAKQGIFGIWYSFNWRSEDRLIVSLVCSDVVEYCEMDYSTRMVEWNRVGKSVKCVGFVNI